MISRPWFTQLLCCLAGMSLVAGCSELPNPEAVSEPNYGKAPAGLAVKAVDPDSVPQDTTLNIRILGSGFDASAKAEFLLNGVPDPGVRTNSTRFVTTTEVIANVTVSLDAVPDLYDAQVTLLAGGKKGIGTEMLAVLAFTELGTLGGTRSNAVGINDEGSVTGRADTTDGSGRAYVWDASTDQMRSLGTLEAYAINNSRTVVGTVAGVGPVRWVYDQTADSWTYERLTTFTPDGTFPTDINQPGQISGWSDQIVAGVGGAVLWQATGEVVALDPSARWSYSIATSINASGLVTGYARNGTALDSAWVWVPDTPNGTSGTFVVLPSFVANSRHRAEGLNDAGDVVGWAETSRGANYALLWRRNLNQNDPRAANYYSAPLNLGAVLGRYGRAFDINNDVRVVGRAHSSANRYTYDPFVWDQVNGMRMLPKPAGGDAEAVRMNETGLAAGRGRSGAIRWQLP